MSDITRNPLCWPNNVPRRAPHQRKNPLFNERSIATATEFVIAEVNRLNQRSWNYRDESVIVSTNLKIKLDGLPAGNQSQPLDSGAAVYFTLRFARNGKWHERPCVLTCDKWIKVNDNLWAIGKDIEAQRARERWGSTSTEQAFQGYLAIPERCGGPAWWIVLGIPSSAQRPDIEDAYRRKSKDCHPDMRNGSQAAFVELQTAFDQAMAQFR